MNECKRCAAGDFTRKKRVDGLRHAATVEEPDANQLEEWMLDGQCEATDGCVVEPDGRCQHGHSSWLLVFGLI